ncbi:MAG TPA: hypothetical protein VNK50_11315 [Calidithermus sp.]|nr:hypothetical protein [Calidithermus sp.]
MRGKTADLGGEPSGHPNILVSSLVDESLAGRRCLAPRLHP